MARARLKAPIRLQGVNPYVVVEAALAGRLRAGWRKPMPVVARLDGQPREGWRINLMPVGDGRFHLYLRGGVRKLAGARVGDLADIELRFDDEYAGGPAHPMPQPLADALAARPEARRSWEALPPSLRKEVLRYLAALKTDEARSRNLSKLLHVLAGGPGRFMARDWSEGAPAKAVRRAGASAKR